MKIQSFANNTRMRDADEPNKEDISCDDGGDP